MRSWGSRREKKETALTIVNDGDAQVMDGQGGKGPSDEELAEMFELKKVRPHQLVALCSSMPDARVSLPPVCVQPKHFLAGAMEGVKCVTAGVVGGAVGLVAMPVIGGMENGAKGAVSGVAKGVAGAVLLPAVGAAAGITQITRGVFSTPAAVTSAYKVSAEGGRVHLPHAPENHPSPTAAPAPPIAHPSPTRRGRLGPLSALATSHLPPTLRQRWLTVQCTRARSGPAEPTGRAAHRASSGIRSLVSGGTITLWMTRRKSRRWPHVQPSGYSISSLVPGSQPSQAACVSVQSTMHTEQNRVVLGGGSVAWAPSPTP